MAVPYSRRLASALVALLLVGTAAPLASAQSQADLRRDNDRLRSQIDDLDRRIDALEKLVAQLEAENASLRQRLATAGPGAGPPPASQPAVDETEPLASPRALLTTLRKGYAEAMADIDVGASTDDTMRMAYLRKLDRWTSRVNRQFKGPVEWHAKIIDPLFAAGRGFTLRLVAVDAATGADVGDPFDAAVSTSVARAIQRLEVRHGLDQTLLLKGRLMPRVHVNEDRMVEGAFDNPRFIGPFAEFGFTVQVTSLTVPPREEE